MPEPRAGAGVEAEAESPYRIVGSGQVRSVTNRYTKEHQDGMERVRERASKEQKRGGQEHEIARDGNIGRFASFQGLSMAKESVSCVQVSPRTFMGLAVPGHMGGGM